MSTASIATDFDSTTYAATKILHEGVPEKDNGSNEGIKALSDTVLQHQSKQE
jgi:hypothetical protein